MVGTAARESGELRLQGDFSAETGESHAGMQARTPAGRSAAAWSLENFWRLARRMLRKELGYADLL
jgi:hypothetical protein